LRKRRILPLSLWHAQEGTHGALDTPNPFSDAVTRGQPGNLPPPGTMICIVGPLVAVGDAGGAGGLELLDGELQQSSWLLADVQPDLIFDVDALMMWETAIRRLGADPTALQMSRGVH